MTTEKSKTNKKWTSGDDYRSNYDQIFGKKTQAQVPLDADSLKDEIKRLRKVADGAENQDREAWYGAHNAGFGVQFLNLNSIRGNHGDYLKVNNAIHIGCFNPLRINAMLDIMSAADHLISAFEAMDMGVSLPVDSYEDLLETYRLACRALKELK